ncbi:MAG: helix-turn-helix domain-containing protein [Ruminococcaceae bacterium]|nr:helix-turn-helix domain-containing protein [Oscillospiraceae bacterium]
MRYNTLHDHGFGSVWTDIYVNRRQGYYTSVNDYHKHTFYEVNLILSGNVKILLGDHFEDRTGCCLVLTRPGTPHYITCRPDTLYSRLYLVFTDAFMADRLPEWEQLLSSFGQDGRILPLTETQADMLRGLMEQIEQERSPLGKRLLSYYILCRIRELSDAGAPPKHKMPPYIVQTLLYLEQHYAEHIVAAELASRLYIGRTTLMTAFKAHTGRTLGEYLTLCRLKRAVPLLYAGKTLEDTAEQCGFSDSSGLIRAFRRHYGMTPREYVQQDTDTPTISP